MGIDMLDLLLIAMIAFAAPVRAETVSLGGYRLTNYRVDMTVGEDNTLDVSESLGVYFSAPRHGLFRQLPVVAPGERRSRIEVLHVNDFYSTFIENGNRIVKIGSPDRLIDGQRKYTLRYVYHLGHDPFADYDELAFNLVGGGWDVPIPNPTFSVTFPKPFDPGAVEFFAGAPRSTSSERVRYKVDGLTIRGRFEGDIAPGQFLTVRVRLPEGYFTAPPDAPDWWRLAAQYLPPFFALIAFLMWRRWGRDDFVPDIVEFNPPKGMSSAELGWAYKGAADEMDVISLIVSLAAKKYLKITETVSKGLFTETSAFILTSLKAYDGVNEVERMFLRELFARGPEVTLNEHDPHMIETVERVLKYLNKENSHLRLFTREFAKIDLDRGPDDSRRLRADFPSSGGIVSVAVRDSASSGGSACAWKVRWDDEGAWNIGVDSADRVSDTLDHGAGWGIVAAGLRSWPTLPGRFGHVCGYHAQAHARGQPAAPARAGPEKISDRRGKAEAGGPGPDYSALLLRYSALRLCTGRVGRLDQKVRRPDRARSRLVRRLVILRRVFRPFG